MFKKFNFGFSIILCSFAVVFLVSTLVDLYTNLSFLSSFSGVLIYVEAILIAVYIIVLICSIFIKKFKEIFIFKYFIINIFSLLIVVSTFILFLYKLAGALEGF